MEGDLALGDSCPKMPLPLLIDFIIQKTYHDLSVLGELLHMKSDMERKIEIYNFANTASLRFSRLLALVKWTSKNLKIVDKSASVIAFLDRQSILFEQTANNLFEMRKGTLENARLPNAHILAAVEVLITGTYSRLPLCIKAIVPPEPISAGEKKNTFLKLNQVIQYRLATNPPPPEMSQILIENGRVKFTVDNEFEATLILLGDEPDMPWRLLNINILVEDSETGENGLCSFNIVWLLNLLQSRIENCDNPLQEVYTVLHKFCQLLQLDVLYSQIWRLSQERLGAYVTCNYVKGRYLTVSYWKELASRELKTDLGYRLTIEISDKRLQILHNPPLAVKDSEQAVLELDNLSIENLLMQSIYVRIRSRLLELKQEILQSQVGQQEIDYSVQGSPATLHVSILSPCLDSEQLLVTVNPHTGSLQAFMPQGDPPTSLIMELQDTLNSDKSRFVSAIGDLRFWIMQRRCRATLQHLPVSIYDKLPLLDATDCPISRLSKHKLFLRLHKHPNSVIVVEFKENDHYIDYGCSLLIAEPVSIDKEKDGVLPKMFFRVLEVIELDLFMMTHGPSAPLELEKFIDGKRKTALSESEYEEDHFAQPKRKKHSPSMLPDLPHVIALFEERIPLAILAAHLAKQEILHQGLTIEALGTGLALKLLKLPSVEGVNPETMTKLNRLLLSATVRMQVKGSRNWVLELVFNGSPLVSTSPWEQGSRFTVYLTYDVRTVNESEKTVDAIVDDWNHITHLFDCIQSLFSLMQQKEYSQHFSIKSYNYKRLILAYGPARSATAIVTWKKKERQFHLGFGCSGQLTFNAHNLLREQLEFFLNSERSCGFLALTLHETYKPVTSLTKFSSTLQRDVLLGSPSKKFTLLIHSPTHLRLIYWNKFCLEIRLKSDSKLSIRDCAYSAFDKSVLHGFSPVHGLEDFLSKYSKTPGLLIHEAFDEICTPTAVPDAVEELISPLEGFLASAKTTSEKNMAFPREQTDEVLPEVQA